jgi:hypothetical protein
MGNQLVNFITCGCESSAPFLQFTKPGANPRRIGDRLVYSDEEHQGRHLSKNAEKETVISNTDNFFCFSNSNVSNLYNNDAIIYNFIGLKYL